MKTWEYDLFEQTFFFVDGSGLRGNSGINGPEELISTIIVLKIQLLCSAHPSVTEGQQKLFDHETLYLSLAMEC